MSDDASVVRARAAEVLEAGEALRGAGVQARARWLAHAATTLAGRVADSNEELSLATGLSRPMVRWAAKTTLDTVREEALLDLVHDAQARGGAHAEPVGMLALVLAGNVFTASARSMLVPLLFGVPVLVKASSKETLFPSMLRDALRETNPNLGKALSLASFPGGDSDCEAALFELAESVSVYGSDETVATLAARLEGRPLLAHGHGVSVAYCGSDSLSDTRISETIERLSLDIAAYDQRGCLSPQIVYVEQAPCISAADFGRRLVDEGLGPMHERLPRGPLPISVGAAQAQWRGVAEVEGTLIRGADHAVAIRPAQPIRWSPTYRNIALSPVSGIAEAFRAMQPIGANLKCVGVDPASLEEFRTELRRSQSLSAYVCALGEMQTPPLSALADGLPIWQGLFRPRAATRRR